MVEILLLCICIIQYIIPLHSYSFHGQDLTAAVCRYMAYEDYGPGCYLDEELVSESSVDPQYLYITTPAVDLPKGSYQVSIVYHTDDTDQKYSVSAAYTTYSVITGHDGNRLPMNDSHVQFSFFSPTKVDAYCVHIDYSGSGHVFVESIAIDETNAWKNILLFFVLLVSLLVDSLILYERRLPLESRRAARMIWAAVLCLTVFSSIPLLSFFMSRGDDLLFHLNRIEAISESLLEGQFPNRISHFWNEGYGYASAVFYGEAFLYVPALLRIMGFSVQGAYKFYVVMVNLATISIAFFCFRRIFHDEKAALIGSAVYVLAPYRLACVYMRAAVGEYTAMTFFPLIFYGLMEIYTESAEDNKGKGNFVPLMLGFTGLIQTHVISCVIAGLFVGLFCAVFIKKTVFPPRLIQLLKAAVGAFLLNCWFLLPFADYMHLGYADTSSELTTLGRMNAHGAFLNQMLTVFQEGTASAYTTIEGVSCTNERNYALGTFVLVAVCYVFYRLYRGGRRTRFTWIGDCSMAFAAVSVFMCTIWFPWDYFQQMNGLFRMVTRNIQFPWRFMGISCFFLTLTTVSLFCLLQEEPDRHLYYMALAVLGMCFVLSADYYMYSYTQNEKQYRYVDRSDLVSSAMGAGEYLPVELPEDFDYLADTQPVSGRGAELSEICYEKGVYTVRCGNGTAGESYVDFPLMPYRGYVCRDRDTQQTFDVKLMGEIGRVRAVIPPGYSGVLCMRFEEPWYWKMSEMVSLVTFLCGAVRIAASRKNAEKLLAGRRSGDEK